MTFVDASHGSHVRIMELFSPRTEVRTRGVMTTDLEPDPESDFQLFGDSRYGLRSNKNWNCNNYRAVMILALDPDPKSHCQPFADSQSGFGNRKKTGILTHLVRTFLEFVKWMREIWIWVLLFKGVSRGVEEARGRDSHDGRLGAVREVQASTGRAVGRHLAVAPSVTDLFLHLHPKNSYSSW